MYSMKRRSKVVAEGDKYLAVALLPGKSSSCARHRICRASGRRVFMRRSVFAVALLLSLITARTAGAAFITYEFSATITDVDVLPDHPRGPATLDLFTSLGGAVGASAFGTFTFDDSATPYGTDPSQFNSNRPGGLAGFTFNTVEGLSIAYSPTATMNMVATPDRWTLDYCCSPRSNVGGFEYTIFQLLSSGGGLRTDVPILQAFDPDILDHGSIHFGGSYAYPMDVRASINDVRPVPEPVSALLLAAGVLAAVGYGTRRRRHQKE
jgi:hypothetical protein